ncbi:hypothetical protein NKJ87_21105 [Mesorhizobium sp. M0027]|uniref:hypothetical protein n=1 Tax=unclassified Mesorhizobium TaxID=325217 RepID=UPI00333783E3
MVASLNHSNEVGGDRSMLVGKAYRPVVSLDARFDFDAADLHGSRDTVTVWKSRIASADSELPAPIPLASLFEAGLAVHRSVPAPQGHRAGVSADLDKDLAGLTSFSISRNSFRRCAPASPRDSNFPIAHPKMNTAFTFCVNL